MAEDTPVISFSDLPAQEAEDELVEQATGDSSVELLHEIYRNLLAYAQTFERLEAFKMGMGLNPGKALSNVLDQDTSTWTKLFAPTRTRSRKIMKIAKTTLSSKHFTKQIIAPGIPTVSIIHVMKVELQELFEINEQRRSTFSTHSTNR